MVSNSKKVHTAATIQTLPILKDMGCPDILYRVTKIIYLHAVGMKCIFNSIYL